MNVQEMNITFLHNEFNEMRCKNEFNYYRKLQGKMKKILGIKFCIFEFE